MRFLIGIITGTILTLFIATALDAPVQTTLDRAARTLTGLWQSLIDSTSDNLFAVPEAVRGERVASEPGRLAKADAPSPAAGAAERPSRAEEPAMALAPPDELPPPPPVKPVVPADPKPVPTGDVAEESEPPFPRPAPPPDESTFGADSTGVWAPFHSQVSARGFAAHLSRTLDHDFRVERQGAGAYQVVVDVTSPEEREALLMEIAEITGQ